MRRVGRVVFVVPGLVGRQPLIYVSDALLRDAVAPEVFMQHMLPAVAKSVASLVVAELQELQRARPDTDGFILDLVGEKES